MTLKNTMDSRLSRKLKEAGSFNQSLYSEIEGKILIELNKEIRDSSTRIWLQDMIKTLIRARILGERFATYFYDAKVSFDITPNIEHALKRFIGIKNFTTTNTQKGIMVEFDNVNKQ